MSNKIYWDIIERAKIDVLDWSKEHGIPIFRIDYVATFENWDNGIGIYIFFRSENEKNNAVTLGLNEKIKQYYLNSLKELKYPFDKYYNVIFFFDSDDNVKKNHEGNYFFRLR